MLWGPAGLQLPGPRSSHLCASRLRLPGHSPTVWAAHNRNVIAPSPGGRTLRRWCRQGTFFSVLGVETAVPSPCPQVHPSACLCPDLLFLQGPQSCGVRTHPMDFTLSRSPFFFFLVLPVYGYQPISLHPRAHLLSLVIPWTSAHQTPLSMDFSRQEYWSGFELFLK